jgi:arylsulfatase A-like enzyme
LAALSDTGLDRKTLVISTTDHGISFPRHKCTLFDGGLEVLLMLRGPGIISGKVVDSLVSQIDIFPTLCEYLSIAPPPWLQGRSLGPLLRGEASEIRDEMFAETTFHAAYQPERAVRTKRYKYIRRYGDPRPQPLSNIDDGMSKELYVAHGYRDQVQPPEALYDLVFDPMEQNNLIARADSEPTLADLRQRLDRWMADTADPLLTGTVDIPPDAVVSNFTDFSAKDVLKRGR